MSSSVSSSVSTSAAPVDPLLTYTPLDLKQKYLFSLYAMAGPTQWIGFAVHAAMDQAEKTPVAWGSGMDSFGVRMANHFGRSFLRENIAFGVRALDHEDPRYFRMEKGTFWNRTRYALNSTFLARRDDGGWMPAYSRFISDYATPFISSTWDPQKFTVAHGIRGGSLGIGMGFGSNLFSEFGPDLKKRFWKRSRHMPDSAAAIAPAPNVP